MNNFNFLDIQLLAQPWLTKAIAHFSQPYNFIELLSAACALVGSLLVAVKGKHAGTGWILFACSNVGWIVFARGQGHWMFLVQQIGFSITSAIGIWQYIAVPYLDTLFEFFDAPMGADACEDEK